MCRGINWAFWALLATNPTNPTTIGRAYGTHSVNYTEALTLCSWGAIQEDREERDRDLMWAEIEIYGRKQQQQHSGHRLGTMEYIRFGSTSQTQFFALLLSSVHSNWARRATDLTFPTTPTHPSTDLAKSKSPLGGMVERRRTWKGWWVDVCAPLNGARI